MRQPRVAHIIGDLNGFGGTEATLLRYIRASAIPLSCHRVFVVRSAGEGDTLGAQMVRAGIDVRAMNQRPGLQSFTAIWRMAREVREFAPDIISGWLYVPALLATLLSCLCPGRPRVMWHIRSLPFQRPLRKPMRYMVQKALAVASRITHPVLVSNSRASVDAHIGIGFSGSAADWTIISNGIDDQVYFPSKYDAREVRAELGIPSEALVIGCIGRVVPEKGYEDLFAALSAASSRLSTLSKPVFLVVAGNGAELQNEAFSQMAQQALPLERVRLLGKRADVPRLMRAFDMFVLPSRSESFPNALVEAMASGIACVSTDAGQSRDVLNMPEFVARAGNPVELVLVLERMLALDFDALHSIGERNRNRVSERYALRAMVNKFDALFHKTAGHKQYKESDVASSQ